MTFRLIWKERRYNTIMNIIHFNVDKNFEPLLAGKKYVEALQDVSDKNIYDADCITINHHSHVTAETLSSFKNLKLIVTRTVGTDHIDIEECKKKDIAVYHVVDYGAYGIAEHAMALLLSGTRRIIDSQKEIKKGVFSDKNFIGFSLKGKVFGVVGTGRIGVETIKLAKNFGMEVIAYDVYSNEKIAKEIGFTYVSLDQLLKESDVISLHAPLMKETEHMIDEGAIEKMKGGVVLINTARGGLIDEKALVKNVEKFRFVGLDVLEDEEHFSADHPLLKYDNVLITPHIAFLTDETVKKIVHETEKCIRNFVNRVDEGRVA